MEVEYNNTHQIGGGYRYFTWTFAEIKQYAADCHDFEDGHELKFMSNVHEIFSVGENCVKAQIPIQKNYQAEQTKTSFKLTRYIKFR